MNFQRAPATLPALTEAEIKILEAVRNLAYGSVEITIHDSRVVLIERKEKVKVTVR